MRLSYKQEPSINKLHNLNIGRLSITLFVPTEKPQQLTRFWVAVGIWF